MFIILYFVLLYYLILYYIVLYITLYYMLLYYIIFYYIMFIILYLLYYIIFYLISNTLLYHTILLCCFLLLIIILILIIFCLKHRRILVAFTRVIPFVFRLRWSLSSWEVLSGWICQTIRMPSWQLPRRIWKDILQIMPCGVLLLSEYHDLYPVQMSVRPLLPNKHNPPISIQMLAWNLQSLHNTDKLFCVSLV